MVLMPKEQFVYPPLRIYRGNDPDTMEHPIPKSVDCFDKMDGFGDRMKYAFKKGFMAGAFFSALDITQISRITDRRVQLARFAYFTLPAVTAACGWMATLEIGKKMFGKEGYAGAYVVAGAAPAAVFSAWRKRPAAFPKVFAVAAIAGATYNYAIENNHYWNTELAWLNPNDRFDWHHRDWSLFGEAKTMEFRPNGKLAMFGQQVPDPGPTYAKFLEK